MGSSPYSVLLRDTLCCSVFRVFRAVPCSSGLTRNYTELHGTTRNYTRSNTEQHAMLGKDSSGTDPLRTHTTLLGGEARADEEGQDEPAGPAAPELRRAAREAGAEKTTLPASGPRPFLWNPIVRCVRFASAPAFTSPRKEKETEKKGG
eukprot:gene16730-biopygen3808